MQKHQQEQLCNFLWHCTYVGATDPDTSTEIMHAVKGFIHRSDYTPAKHVLLDCLLGRWDRIDFWMLVLEIMGAEVLSSDSGWVSWTFVKHGRPTEHYCFFLEDGIWFIKNGFDLQRPVECK